MKTSSIVFVFLPFCLAVPAPAAEDDFACACPMPLCPPDQPERCECQNSAIAACWAQQVEDGKICPAPALKDCNSTESAPASISTSLSARHSTSVLTAPASSASCACEPVFCPQVWPQSCRCANSAKTRCHQRCGGSLPQLQDCGDTPDQSASLYGGLARPTESKTASPLETPELDPGFNQPVPSVSQILKSSLSYKEPSAIPSVPEPERSCECEPAACILSWPAGCLCQNKAKLDCYDTCGGAYPKILDCGSDANATSTSDLEELPQFTDTPEELPSEPDVTPNPACQCDPVFCAQSWPLSCQCSNQAASDCAAICGRPTPQFLDCDGPAPSDIQTELPDLFSMIPDPSDIPVIFTNLIPDLPDPQDLPEYLENLPDYINDIPDNEPWSETHNWFSFLFPGPTAAAQSAVPELPESAVFSREERVAALTTDPPAVTSTATPSYRVCGHRAADPCPTGYDCVAQPGANCGPEVDCGGYCVDALNGRTLLADVATSTSPSATPSNTTTLSFSQITDYFPSTLSTSRRLVRPPRQVSEIPAPDSATTASDGATSTPILSPQIPCGEGYPPCDPGLQCVDIFVSGIGFAEKRSFCAFVPSSSSSGNDADIVSASAPGLVASSVIVAVSNTPIWPDTAWPGPITTLSPMFGPGPVGISLRSSSTPIVVNSIPALLPPLAPIPTPLHTPSVIPTPTNSLSLPSDTSPAIPLVMHCGGPANGTCPEIMACVRDLDTPAGLSGCGPPCGEVGVCIVPETCGGFVGKQCSQVGRVCVDDPRDDCDPASGGADCIGICI